MKNNYEAFSSYDFICLSDVSVKNETDWTFMQNPMSSEVRNSTLLLSRTLKCERNHAKLGEKNENQL